MAPFVWSCRGVASGRHGISPVVRTRPSLEKTDSGANGADRTGPDPTGRGGARMGTIETFEHTADVGLRVLGGDLDDLFRTAAEGMFDYIVANRDAVRDLESESIALRGDESAELLV